MTTWALVKDLNVSLKKYYRLKNSLNTEKECIFYGDRIVIP